MLDSALKTAHRKDIDWLYVQRALDRFLSGALFWMTRFTALITPIMIFPWNYGLANTRMIVFAVLVAFCAMLWLIREIIAKDRLSWRTFILNWPLAILLIAVLFPLLYSGGDGGVVLLLTTDTSALAWISLIAFSALLGQTPPNPPLVKGGTKISPFTSAGLHKISPPLLRGRLRGGSFMNHLSFIFFTGFIILFIIIAILSIQNKRIPDFGFSSQISNTVSITRLFQQHTTDYAFLGSGLGQGKLAFWQGAESVSLDALLSGLPAIGGTYTAILWDGGILLLIAFIIFTWIIPIRVLWNARKNWRKTILNSKERKQLRALSFLSAMLIIWLIFLFFKSFSFLVLYATFMMIVLFANKNGVSKISHPVLREGLRGGSFFSYHPSARILRVLRLMLLIFVILFIWAIYGIIHPDFGNGLFVWRAREANKALSLTERGETFSKGLTSDSEDKIITIVNQDMRAIDINALSGVESWSYARSLSALSLSAQGSDSWMLTIQSAYERALLELPRNVLLLTEVSRFYQVVLSENGTFESGRFATSGLVADSDRLSRAQTLITQALAIDPNNPQARIQQAMILISQDKKEDALNILRGYTVENPDVAYQAATLALELSKFDEAVGYYLSAIYKNPKHLQARFELAQAYIALAQNEKALEQMDALDEYVAEDDIETRNIINQLRGMIE